MRITELSVPKSSELLTASGSATQREPLTMNAYSCRPAVSGTETVQTPGAPERFSCVAPLVHSLKSPTSATVAAPESTNTKRTSWTVSRAAAAWAAIAACGARAEIRDPTTLETATSAAIPAAIATPPRGEIRTIHSVRQHRRVGEVAAVLYSQPPLTI